MAGRLKPEEHSKHPWLIDDIADDFDLIDAWALPVSGTLEEFADLCRIFATLDFGAGEDSTAARALFTVRDRLGTLLRWNENTNDLAIPGSADRSLRGRLSADQLAEVGDTSLFDDVQGIPFRPVYVAEDECALELSDHNVHAAVHLGWVTAGNGRFTGQMGVYVKTRGRFGRTYMTAIAPFRHYIVYPALLRRIGREWNARPTS
ncbi:MAG: DUF2867 domain-containing protein [Acidimicrobiales bacterium]